MPMVNLVKEREWNGRVTVELENLETQEQGCMLVDPRWLCLECPYSYRRWKKKHAVENVIMGL
jgi:hypothetical protein